MAYDFNATRLSGGENYMDGIDDGGTLSGLSSAADAASTAIPLPWASFALKGASAIAGGVGEYIKYKQAEAARKFQEKMLQSADDRAWQQVHDNEQAYKDANVQRSSNTLATLGQVVGQGQSLREKLMMLRGGV